MKTRAITGIFFVIAMLSSVLINEIVFYWFYFALSMLCLWEYFDMFKLSSYHPNRVGGMVSAMALFMVFNPFLTSISQIKYIPFVMVYGIFVYELFRNKKSFPFANIALTLLGIIFTTLPFLCFYHLAFFATEYDYSLPLGFLILLWSSDTGAYLFGVTLGKHKLFERHSPKKSWEGFLGGITTSVFASIIWAQYHSHIHILHWIVIALIISILGTMGDLVESMLKRSLNIKDSGNILPGHGGVLDRFDGLFIAAPMVLAYLKLVG